MELKIEIKSKIVSTSLEIVDIHIEFNPMDDREEGLAAVAVTITDLVREYAKITRPPEDQKNE